MKSNNGLTFLLVIAGFIVVLYLVQNWNRHEAVPNEGEVSMDDMNAHAHAAADAHADMAHSDMNVHGATEMAPADMMVPNNDPRASDGNLPHPNTTEGLVGAGVQDAMNVADNQEAQRLRQASCFPKEQLLPEELLPQDNSSTWAQVNPQGMGTLKDKNFLQSGHHIGLDSVGSTQRNSNLQLRSEPPNPQVVVSPWMQTTIQPDTSRRPLEVGGCQ